MKKTNRFTKTPFNLKPIKAVDCIGFKPGFILDSARTRRVITTRKPDKDTRENRWQANRTEREQLFRADTTPPQQNLRDVSTSNTKTTTKEQQQSSKTTQANKPFECLLKTRHSQFKQSCLKKSQISYLGRSQYGPGNRKPDGIDN